MTGEQRKSPRIVRLVPLLLSDDDQTVEAQSAVVSAHGALILSPRPFVPGRGVTVTNRQTRASIDGMVVWAGDGEPPLAFKIGVEFSRPAPEFWGEESPA
ncbi:MAG: PilZ domain-containing protein [Thermoanaerobaculia bacterium]